LFSFQLEQKHTAQVTFWTRNISENLIMLYY
jgi:hypothetical protein